MHSLSNSVKEMGLKMKMCMKLALASSLILCVFPLKAGSQTALGCSFQGLELDKCLNQRGEYVFLEPCCRALNQALRVGFHCLCSMFTTTDAPQLTSLFSLSLSSCYIMVPPLTVCRDLGTRPISLPIPPNSSTKEVRTAQQTPQVPVLPPPNSQAPSSSSISGTPWGSSSMAEREPPPSRNVTSMVHVVENENNVTTSGSEATAVFCFLLSLLSLPVVYSLVLY